MKTQTTTPTTTLAMKPLGNNFDNFDWSSSFSKEESDVLKNERVKDFGTNYEMLESIMLFQSPTRDRLKNEAKAKFLLDLIKDYTGVQGVVVKGNLYFTKGDAEFYPTVVAHYDTAQDYYNDMQIIKTKDWIFGFDNHTARQCGIGADDSVGIYFGIEMLKRLDNCKMVLFHSEEQGCIGSHACDMDFFKDSLIVTQLDRRSFTSDFITYTNGVQVFSPQHEELVRPIIEKYGYSFTKGICTDVGALRFEGLAVSSHNLSCGYLNEHSNEEVIHINSMENAFCLAEEMLIMLAERNEPLTFERLPVRSIKSMEDYFASTIHTEVKREMFTEAVKDMIYENMYADYTFFIVDTDNLCTQHNYYGGAEDYEKDLISGELLPLLFVALTDKCYNELRETIFDPIISDDDVVQHILKGHSPTTYSEISGEDLEYYPEYGVIYCKADSTYFPYQFTPNDCFELPDDRFGTLTALCNDYYF